MARALTEVGAVSGSRGGLRPGQRHQPHLVGADQGANPDPDPNPNPNSNPNPNPNPNQAAAANARIAEAFTNQDRLRENIRSMEKVGSNKLTDRYLKDLDKEEDELIQMRRTIARLEEEEALLVREMSAALLELGTQVQQLRDET